MLNPHTFRPFSISVSDKQVAQCNRVLVSAKASGLVVRKSAIYRAALASFAALPPEQQAQHLRNELLQGDGNV
jgi:hypothetical protein